MEAVDPERVLSDRRKWRRRRLYSMTAIFLRMELTGKDGNI